MNSAVNYLTKVALVWYNDNNEEESERQRKPPRERKIVMALTKAFLKEVLSKAGVSPENVTEAVDSIIDGHVTSINALREEIATYKADAEKLPNVQKELDTLRATANDEWETKYTAEHEAFEQFKASVAAEKELSAKKALYTDLLKGQHIDEKRLEAILKVTDFDSMTVKDGQLVNVGQLTEAIKSDWAGFIVTDQTDGAYVDTPPNTDTAMTKADFEKMPLSKQMEYANAHADAVAALYKE